MSDKVSRIFTLLSVLVLAGCSKSLDIQLEPEVSVFTSSDTRQTVRLTARDAAYRVLDEWLDEHGSGWYPTSGRYPGGVYVKSGTYGIQITESLVVLYSAVQPEPKAMYVHKIGKGELRQIKDIGL